MPVKRKQPRCQAKSTTTGKRCQRPAVYRANTLEGTAALCGTHARGYTDAVRL